MSSQEQLLFHRSASVPTTVVPVDDDVYIPSSHQVSHPTRQMSVASSASRRMRLPSTAKLRQRMSQLSEHISEQLSEQQLFGGKPQPPPAGGGQHPVAGHPGQMTGTADPAGFVREVTEPVVIGGEYMYLLSEYNF